MFKSHAKWKEELIVSGTSGQFSLDFTMGVLTVYLPSETEWQRVAPPWASDLYLTLKQELERWCKANNAILKIDATAVVFNCKETGH